MSRGPSHGRSVLDGVPAMVLAAGLGTRLRPLTDERPKPAVPVGNRPLVGYALEQVARSGGSVVAVNAHHLADVLEEAVTACAPPALRVSVLREETLLGTGGGIRNAAATLLAEDPELVVVLNADILFEPDLARAIATHRRLGAVATMVLRSDPDARRYGAVEIDDAGRVRRLLGVPETVEARLGAYMFTGVHVLSRAAFEDLPTEGCIVRASYRRWIDTGAVVAGHVDESPWRDLGTPAAYLAANVAAAEAQPDGCLVHPDARIGEGASLRQTVLGAGCRVAPGVHLERVVVWDGVTVTESLADAIVTPKTIVRLRDRALGA